MDIAKELSSNQTILLIMSSDNYNKSSIDVTKPLTDGSVCYVTLNKTYSAIKENLEKSKINLTNIVFIDAISKSIQQKAKQTENCYFISSPGALTEMSLTISKFIKHDFNYIIFDSLSNLMIYEKKAPVAKFVSSLVNKIKGSKTKAVFFAVSVKEQDALIKETSMFVDKVINLEK